MFMKVMKVLSCLTMNKSTCLAFKNSATTLSFILSFFIGHVALSQGWTPVGARSNSLANASVALEDVWAYHHNPANLTALKKWSCGISYENRFLLKELQSQGLVLAIPLKVGVISTGVQSYGFKNFRTNRIGLGYSLFLSEFLSMGVQLNYHQLRLTDAYGMKQSLTAEVGLQAMINKNWKIGCSIFNIGRSLLSSYSEDRLTTLIRFGTYYKLSEKVMVLAEAEKNIEYPLRLKSAIEYAPMSKVFLRAGIATQPIEVSAGFGYKFKSQYNLDFGSSYHQILGWSPHFSFTYQMKN